jgi:hypothetical protein
VERDGAETLPAFTQRDGWLRREPSKRSDTSDEPQLWSDWRRAASQPFNQANLTNGLRTTAAMNVFRPVGKITYDSFQLSVTRR